MHKDVAKSKGVTESMPLADKIKALKGLTVGVTNPGALTAHLAAFVIRKAGYNPQQDVNIVPIGSGPTWLDTVKATLVVDPLGVTRAYLLTLPWRSTAASL